GSYRSRSSARHHRAILNRRRRTRDVVSYPGATEETLMVRGEAGAICNLRAAQRRVGNMKRAAVDCLAVYKVVARSHGDCPGVMGVGVIEIVAFVDDRCVANKSVVDVHVADVSAAAAIPRMKWFAPTQREPADAAAKSKSDSPVAAADEADERRPVHWISV